MIDAVTHDVRLALQALLSAVWRRKPKHRAMIHSDQGAQFTGKDWQSFLSKHNLDASMSRRGNCHDNAVAESFLQLLKHERIRRQTYLRRDAARQDEFDYIEIFDNPTRKHTNNGMLSLVDDETEQKKLARQASRKLEAIHDGPKPEQSELKTEDSLGSTSLLFE